MDRAAVLFEGGEPFGGGTIEVVVVFGGTSSGRNVVGSDEPSGEATIIALGTGHIPDSGPAHLCTACPEPAVNVEASATPVPRVE
jgi:hypothetical protein